MVQIIHLLILLRLIPLLPRMLQQLSGPQSALNPARLRVRECTPSRRWDAAGAGDMVRMAATATHGFGMFAVRNAFAEIFDSDGESSFDSEDSDMSMSSWSSILSMSSCSSSSMSSVSSADEHDMDFDCISTVVRLFHLLHVDLARPNAGLRYAPPALRARTIGDYDDAQCWELFRFKRADLVRLRDALELPPRFLTKNRRYFSGEEGLLLVLRRLARYTTFQALSQEFGRYPSHLCEGFNHILSWMDERFCHLIDDSQHPPHDWPYETGLNRWAPQVGRWAAAIRAKIRAKIGGDLPEEFGAICCFIDGTFRSMCRPGTMGVFADIQRAFYTWYKKAHGINLQSVIAPNGIIIDLFGPCTGRQNDRWMATRSAIYERLGGLFALAALCTLRLGGDGGTRYTCLGDSIYPVTLVVVRQIMGAILNPQATQINRCLAAIRIVVEHGFAIVINLWKHVDHKTNTKLFQSPIGCATAYRVAVFLTNCRTCVSGSQVASQFGCFTPSLEDYVKGYVDPQGAPVHGRM